MRPLSSSFFPFSSGVSEAVFSVGVEALDFLGEFTFACGDLHIDGEGLSEAVQTREKRCPANVHLVELGQNVRPKVGREDELVDLSPLQAHRLKVLLKSHTDLGRAQEEPLLDRETFVHSKRLDGWGAADAAPDLALVAFLSDRSGSCR